MDEDRIEAIKYEMAKGAETMAALRAKELENLDGVAEEAFIDSMQKLFSIADRLTELMRECLQIDYRNPMVPELAVTLSAIIYGITRNNITEELSILVEIANRRDSKQFNS